MIRTIYIETLGCSKNRVDSEIMMGALLRHNFEAINDSKGAEVIVVNTCGFLTSAVNESVDRSLSLAEEKLSGKCKRLIVAGCMVERYREKILHEIPEIDAVIGTSDYTKIVNCIEETYQKEDIQVYLGKRPLYSLNNTEADRAISTKNFAYLKIAEGCSNSCSFCNIPKLRGKQRSRPIENIKRELINLLDSGVKEINLISQDSSAYGNDLSSDINLPELIKSLLEATSEDFWLRVFYSYPNNYPLELLKLMNEDSRLVPYIDIPFQHASDSVLKAMNRKITANELESTINTILETVDRVALRTTFIVGFPTETADDFAELIRLVKKEYFYHIGVFAYSHEDNIRSAQYGDIVSDELKEERRRLLMETQQGISQKKNQSMIGQIQKVLVEGTYEETDLLLKGRNKYQGVEVDGIVLINDGYAEVGKFSNVKITEAHPYDLIGEVID